MAGETLAKDTKHKSATDGFIFADSDNISMFPEQTVDNMMHVLIAMGAELWTTRRRMMTLEKVLEKVGVSTDDVEKFQPSKALKDEWEEERNIFIKRTFSALERRGGANDKQLDMSKDM